MCGKEESPDVQCSWRRGSGSRNQVRFQGIRKIFDQSKNNAFLIDKKQFVLNAVNCFAILRLSVSKVKALKGSMEGNCLVVTCTWTVKDKEIPIHVLVDCGATGIALIDPIGGFHLCRTHSDLKVNRQVEVID